MPSSIEYPSQPKLTPYQGHETEREPGVKNNITFIVNNTSMLEMFHIHLIEVYVLLHYTKGIVVSRIVQDTHSIK